MCLCRYVRTQNLRLLRPGSCINDTVPGIFLPARGTDTLACRIYRLNRSSGGKGGQESHMIGSASTLTAKCWPPRLRSASSIFIRRRWPAVKFSSRLTFEAESRQQQHASAQQMETVEKSILICIQLQIKKYYSQQTGQSRLHHTAKKAAIVFATTAWMIVPHGIRGGHVHDNDVHHDAA